MCELGSVAHVKWPKTPRLRSTVRITEKLDGTNAAIHVTPEGVYAQSRNRLLTVSEDNYGFAAWVKFHEDAITEILGPGVHFGEWWGHGIQRGYGMLGRRFSLFSEPKVELTSEAKAIGITVVPELFVGTFIEGVVMREVEKLRRDGSVASPGFAKPEGVVVEFLQARPVIRLKAMCFDPRGNCFDI